ncbi:thiamine-binding protein [Dactylosporangium sp. NPDC000244]|uniref:thiamine-binding protein n=1 Tax=Dactylosporangium sp. NPDC000244 TaxID=3154365 RepID=UPI0033334265
MSVLVAFSVTPLGLGEDVGSLVAEAVRVVRASGLPNRTDAMFTTVEGSTWEEVMAVVQAAVAVVQASAPRTSTVIKVDWRDGPVGRLESKVATVEQRLASS